MISPVSPTVQGILTRVEITPEGCWLWTGGTSRGGGKHTQTNPGYPSVWVREERRSRRGHVLMFEVFHGPVPAGFEVAHRCGSSLCLAPGHLEAQTPEDNRRERIERHRALKGGEPR